MPIILPFPFQRITEAEFHKLDYKVMAEVFRVHRELGPHFLREGVYHNELEFHCRSRGICQVAKEVRLCVTFGKFSKTYYADFVADRSAIYELKAVEAIHPVHERQTLNYLLLANVGRGKVINMRAPSVQHRFVSTNLTYDLRRRVEFDCTAWVDTDSDSAWFREIMQELVTDWGAFLELQLFYDAIAFFRSGKDGLVKPVEIIQGKRIVATQQAHLLNPITALKITALPKNVTAYERRLQRFLNLTNLHILQWVNFNRHRVVFRTMRRD